MELPTLKGGSTTALVRPIRLQDKEIERTLQQRRAAVGTAACSSRVDRSGVYALRIECQ